METSTSQLVNKKIIYPKYSNRQDCANSVAPDETHIAASDQSLNDLLFIQQKTHQQETK